MQPAGAPVVAAVDDTLVRKRGTKIAGVSWRRDPLGPAFATNFIRAQRLLQISAGLPMGDGSVRMVPVDVVHAPSPVKPRPWASDQEWRAYRTERHASSLGVLAARRVTRLRSRLDACEGAGQRTLIMVGDGGYTTQTVLRGLPDRTTFIGRLRADATLYHLPPSPVPGQPGRRRLYGERAPTPEQIRQTQDIPWQLVRVHAAGRWHDFRVKTIAPLRWRATSAVHELRLVVVAPLGYRPRKGARILYRKPAYLICTDTNLSLERLLQAYVWRSDIEVNFRDEKTLLGVGQAQVRTAASVEAVPTLLIAAYATMLVAAARLGRNTGHAGHLPPPKWSGPRASTRLSTQALLRQLRAELWGEALGVRSFPHFAAHLARPTKPDKRRPDLTSAVLYACN